jgi:hypothetical protein
MSGYVVLVDFHLKPGRLETFRELIDINARQSAQMEPGRRRFDVIEPHAAADAILFMKSTAIERTSTHTCDPSTTLASTPQARDLS